MIKQSVLSLSGGMDSTSLLIKLLEEHNIVHTVSFDYGQKHKQELSCVDTILEYLREKGFSITHKLVDLTSLSSLLFSSLTTVNKTTPEGYYAEDNMKATVVPNRNSIFSSIIYGYALSIATMSNMDVQISLAVHQGDHNIYPDCRVGFFNTLTRAFQIGNWGSEKVSHYLPYIDKNKADILREAYTNCERLSLDFDFIFRNTNTSYSPLPDGRSEGKTGADIERILAFHELGRPDPFLYTEPWGVVLANALEVERNYYKNKK